MPRRGIACSGFGSMNSSVAVCRSEGGGKCAASNSFLAGIPMPPNSSLQRTRLRSPLNSISLGHTFLRRLVYCGGVFHCQGARESAFPGHGFPARFLLLGVHRPSSRQGQPSWRAVRAEIIRSAARIVHRDQRGMARRKYIRPRASSLGSFLISPVSWNVRPSGIGAGARSEGLGRGMASSYRRGWVWPNPSLQRTRLRSPLNSISLGHATEVS